MNRLVTMRASPPETRFAQSGDFSIAYQVVGNGPPDLVLVPGFVSHLEQNWLNPFVAEFLARLASFSRLIISTNAGPDSPIDLWERPAWKSGWTTFAQSWMPLGAGEPC